jgi:hypothetical protein
MIIKQEEIKSFLLDLGYTEDRWGHMIKEFPNAIRRYKFQKISLRVEKRSKAPNSRWLNEAYGSVVYYKDLRISEQGKLTNKK